MTKINFANWEPFSIPPAALAAKKKVLWSIVVASAVIALPLAIKDYLFGYYWLSFTLVSFVVAICIDAACIHYKTDILVPVNVVVSILITALILNIYRFGLVGVYWVYPISTILLHVLPIRTAHFFNCILVGGTAGLIYTGFDIDVFSRTSLSLVITWVVATVVLTTIRNLNESLRNQAVKDPVTGAYNENMLDIFLSDCLAQKQRSQTNSALVAISFDNYKSMCKNKSEAFSHSLALKFSEVIKANTRKIDVIFRISDDQFLILYRYLDQPTEFNSNLNRLQNVLSNFSTREGYKAQVGLALSEAKNAVGIEQWLDFSDKGFQATSKAS